MKRLSLPSGVRYAYDDHNNKICVGSNMGRRDVLPKDRSAPVKLQLEKLRWVDGDYDQWGAYWGNNGRDHIYCGWGDCGDIVVFIFTRASSRAHAKANIRRDLPNARFYR